jgi:cyanophycin synthetase
VDIVSTAAYVGPNIYATLPLLRLTIDLRHRAAASVASYGAGMLDALVKVLPGLATDRMEDGSLWIDRARSADDCGLGELIAHIALNLQQLVGQPSNFASAKPLPGTDEVEVFYGFESEAIGLDAGDVACDILIELVAPRDDGGKPYDLESEIARFVRSAEKRSLGPSALELVRSAEARDIPWFRLNDASLIQVGQGKYQKRIEAALTSMTSHIAVEIAGDKNVCNRILEDLGLPVPKQRMVDDAEDAIAAANRIGYPVVVKPLDGNHGRGVTVNITSDDGVAAAFRIAEPEGSAVIVESMISGDDHRLLVVNGELVAAARRVPGHVVGDGAHTIEELVDIVNADPRRGAGHENVLTKLQLDDQAMRLLGEKNYAVSAVPPAGEVVYLRKTANISTGGTAVDVTDIIHPDNKLMAERAIKAVGLDIGAVDFLTSDITQSYRDTGGAICEINAGPGLRMHIAPSEGKPRNVGGAVMDMLFPPGTQSRIPIAALTGTNGKTTCARMLSHILKMSGHVVGQTSTDAVLIDGNVTVKGDMTGPVSARMVLRDPSVDIAVLETARGGIARSGLGYMYCDVGAVLNVTSDHLGLGGVDTLDELARVKRVVAEVTRGTLVLNADNEYTLKMAGHSPAKSIMYVTRDPAHPLVREHIRLGKRAMVLEQGINGEQIVIYDKGTQIPLIWTHLIPATIEGKALHNVENAMFAAAMAYALGKTLDQLRNGLRTFDNTFFQSPGRMNVYDEHGFRVILDYGHNEAAVGAMVDLVERLKPRGQRIVCVTCPGDRRDEDVKAIAAKVAGKFDTYICHRDDDLRRRGPEEIPQLMRAALLELGVPEAAILIVPEEVAAIDTALGMARPDDLVLIFCDGITRCWKRIIYFKPENAQRPAAPAAPRAADLAFDVPAGYRMTTDERGVLLTPLAPA